MKFQAHAGGKERGTNLIKRFTLASTGAITAWKVRSTRTRRLFAYVHLVSISREEEEEEEVEEEEEWQNRRAHRYLETLAFSFPLLFRVASVSSVPASPAWRDADLIAALIFMSLLLSWRLRNAVNKSPGQTGLRRLQETNFADECPVRGRAFHQSRKKSETPDSRLD